MEEQHFGQQDADSSAGCGEVREGEAPKIFSALDGGPNDWLHTLTITYCCRSSCSALSIFVSLRSPR